MTIRPTKTMTLALSAILLLASPLALVAQAGPAEVGTVLSSTRASTTDGSYEFAVDSGLSGNQLVGGRGASFAFHAFAGIVPAYNAQSTNDVAYWSCGSSCGKRAILDTATGSDQTAVTCADPARYTGECSAKPEAAAPWTSYGASDAPLKASEYAATQARGEFLHLPLAVGTVTLSYNLASCGHGDVKLTASQVDKIFRGEITMWNDARLTPGNDCLLTEATVIQPVVRCDGSGTTFVFTDWLARTAGAPWTAQEASPMSYSFKAANMICGPQNPGVAAQIQGALGRIGYVELAQAYASGLTHALVENGDKTNFVEATTTTGSNAAAAKALVLPASQADWSQVTLVAAPGVDSYPVTSFTYAMVWANPWTTTGNTNQLRNVVSADEYASLKDFLSFAFSDAGQANLPDGYSHLPDEVQAINELGVSRMNYGERKVVTVGGLPGDKSVLDQGLPTRGTRGTLLDGIFYPDASAYRPAANGLDTANQNLAYVQIDGTVVVAGLAVSLDGGIVGKVAAGRTVPTGVYGTAYGQIVDGILLVHSVA